jgi:hypothetical protein
MQHCFLPFRFVCSGRFTPSFGAFPTRQLCFEFVYQGAAGVFTEAECPFLKADFLENCCGPTDPIGLVCPICEPDQILINP